MKRDITIYTKQGNTLRFNDVRPYMTYEQIIRSHSPDISNEEFDKRLKHYKKLSPIQEYIKEDTKLAFYYESQSTKDKNLFEGKWEDILGVSITIERAKKEDKENKDVKSNN